MLWTTWAALAIGATYTVGPAGRDFTTVNGALAAASDGDTLVLDPGEYVEQIDIHRAVTLRGAGPDQTTLRADPAGAGNSIVRTYARVTIADLAVTGDLEPWHCVRVWEGVLVLRNVHVHHCRAKDGLGGMRTDPGTELFVYDSTFEDNAADTADKATSGGGAIYSRSANLVVERSTFARNGSGKGDGGAILAIDGVVAVRGSTFADNTADDDGAAILVRGEPGNNPDRSFSGGVRGLYLYDNTFTGNVTGDRGAALFATDVPSVELVRNVVCGNTAGGFGGAVYGMNVGHTHGRVHHERWVANTAPRGEALYVVDSTLDLRHLHVVGHGANAAIEARTTTFALRDSVVAHNAGVGLTYRSSDADVDGNAWWANGDDGEVGPGALRVDPGFVEWTGACDDDLRLAPGSPLVDAASDADADGTPGDIGAFGGPEGHPCLADGDRDGDGVRDGCDPCPDGGAAVDGDGDGALACVDCDDTDPGVRPGAVELAGTGVDEDCDGVVD